MNQVEARALFERLLSVPDGRIDVTRVALAIAAEEYPYLDVEACVAELDAIAARGLDALPAGAPADLRLERAREVLFRELGFGGDRCDFAAERSSFLNEVLRTRTGLPIALATVFVHVGRRMGLDCAGIAFPGHFLAKVRTGAGEVVLDPFHGGQLVGPAELEERLRRTGGRRLDAGLLADSAPRPTVARMLRNLKNLYVRRKDLPRAYGAVDRLLVATPESADDVRDRGLLAMQLGGDEAARRDLARYLELAPNAHDAGFVRAKLAAVAGRRSLLN